MRLSGIRDASRSIVCHQEFIRFRLAGSFLCPPLIIVHVARTLSNVSDHLGDGCLIDRRLFRVITQRSLLGVPEDRVTGRDEALILGIGRRETHQILVREAFCLENPYSVPQQIHGFGLLMRVLLRNFNGDGPTEQSFKENRSVTAFTEADRSAVPQRCKWPSFGYWRRRVNPVTKFMLLSGRALINAALVW